MVSVLYSGAVRPGLSVNSLRQTVHIHHASIHQAAKLVAALLRVTAGLAVSNGSLPMGLWLTSPAGWLSRTGISSGTLCSVIKYGLPLPFLLMPILQGGSLLQRVRRQYTTAMTKSKVPIQLHCQSVTKNRLIHISHLSGSYGKQWKTFTANRKCAKVVQNLTQMLWEKKRRHGKATNNRVDT